MEELSLFLKGKPLSFKIVLVLFLCALTVAVHKFQAFSTEQQDEPLLFESSWFYKPRHVKGIHLTSWVAGSLEGRKRIRNILKDTEINSVVVAVKEIHGEVYVPGVPSAKKYGAYVDAIPDLRQYLAGLKARGIYPIARIVVFKDQILATKRLDLAVKKPDGSLWKDYRGKSWVDPYSKEVWDYNLEIAERCIRLGFDEIQFDYIRYPSDGNIRLCRYSYAQHSSSSSAKNIVDFLKYAHHRLKPLGAKISIDIFGLIPSVDHDMGIGQSFLEMTEWVDYVSPMVYPSHYARGEYGIPSPNREPYKVVYQTMSDAKAKLGEKFTKLRPYLQDFSWGGVHYGTEEVRAQIQACEDLGVNEWLLWSPSSRFTLEALKPSPRTIRTAKIK